LVLSWGVIYSTVWRYERDDPREEKRVSRYIEGFWAAWTFMSDGGTQAKCWYAGQRILGGLITASGIVYLAAVLAFVVDMVREQMDSMRVGKGQVYEHGHTVILHWTDRTIPLATELCIANDAVGGGVVVILAKESMESMTQELSTQLPTSVRHGTKIVCRHGNPAIVSDLIKVSVDRAKAIIILAEGSSADDSDSATLRCILSMQSMGYKLNGHIVAEVRDIDNEPLLQLVGGKLIETFVSHDVLGRLMLMSVRQMGLADMYDSMLGFDGMEFYMKEWPTLVGEDFGCIMERFPEAVPIGIRSRKGEVFLNPSPDKTIYQGDQLIVIAEDVNSYKPEAPCSIEAGTMPPEVNQVRKAEKVLLCGWRRDIRDILKLLDRVVPPGSEVHTMTHSVPAERRNEMLLDEGLNVDELINVRLVHQWGSTSSRRRLELLPLEHYTSCLIFADQSYEEDTMQADSHSLATLVLIRDIQARRKLEVRCPITCEVLDSRTARTIAGQKQLSLMSDFVQSNQLVARILAMICEARSVKLILNELLAATGNSLLIVPSSNFVAEGEEISFWSVAKRTSARKSILIGYQEKRAGSTARETTLNPDKKNEARSWERYDLAIIAVDSDRGGPDAATIVRALEGDNISEVSPKVGHAARPQSSSPIDDVPEEVSICASADTASSAMVKLAARYCMFMNEDERHTFGNYLGVFGESCKTGILPAGAKDQLPSILPSQTGWQSENESVPSKERESSSV